MWVYDTATWIPVYGRVSLSSLDIPSCSYSDTISSTAIYFHGITILPDDEIYMVGIPFRGSSQSSGIFRRTYNSGLGLHFYAAIPATDSIQALTCDYNGLVYGAGKYVFVFDPADSTVTSLGDLPPGMAAGGDMAYHEGVFYLTTANNELVQLDMDNPLNSTIVATFPDSIDLIEGLATFPFRCDSIVTYAVATGETGSTIYHLDFDTYELTLVCNGIPRGVLDAATATECILPPCEIYADLDADDSSGDTLNNFLRYTCAAPVAIADGDTEVYSPFPIDSVKLNLIGTLDPGQEYLATTAAAGISIQGNGSPSLVLANEVIRSRYQSLRHNLVKWGYSNSCSSMHDSREFSGLEGFFDLILVDAPCSGEGLFRKDPGATGEWSEEGVQLCAGRQKRILADAVKLLAPDGIMLFCTCTYNRQENEDNANWLKDTFGLHPEPIRLEADWGIVSSGMGYQFYPHRVRGEGFYLAA